jgi:hypothetical protein
MFSCAGGTFETRDQFLDWIARFSRAHFSKPFYYKGRRFGIPGFAGYIQDPRSKGQFGANLKRNQEAKCRVSLLLPQQ